MLSKSPIVEPGTTNNAIPYTSDSLSTKTDSADGTEKSKPIVTLTPSATIRQRYYQAQERNDSLRILDDEDDDDDDEEENKSGQKGWPMTSYYAPLKDPLDSPKSMHSFMSSDVGSILSLRTEVFGTDDTQSISSTMTMDNKKQQALVSRHNTLFRSKTGSEPKIILEDDDHHPHGGLKRSKSKSAASLLSKLSKTTAPMRARISAMSRSGSSLQLRTSQDHPSSTFSTPLRRSAESMLNMPVTPRKVLRSRGQSFSHSNEPPVAASEQKKVLRQHQPTNNNTAVYPALLSKVAEAFRDRVIVETKIKDSIEYKDAFDGKHAVDKLAGIIKTNDRNLAILLGRALDAQKFFHDVNYEHRLRDSVNELYQFRERIHAPQAAAGLSNNNAHDDYEDEEDEKSVMTFMGRAEKTEDGSLPNGVFTLLTDCYSPTCTREKLCYSVFCPRRLEQQTKQKGLHRSSSRLSLTDKDDRLWIRTVPKEVASKLDNNERKRQENIFELIYTERDFVNDLTYVQKYWIEPLMESEIIPAERRRQFIDDVFHNIMEVRDVNAQLAAAFEARQKVNPVVDYIGDIMLQHVALFSPFVQYGAHQMVGKYVFEAEKSANPEFARFVETTERLPQSRKLELNGYLTKPTTRLGRYNLLLREILKHTPPGHPDQEYIPKAMNVIAEFLSDVNHETGKMESRFNLQLLSEKLYLKTPGESMDEMFTNLHLDAEERKLIIKGSLKKKASGSSESADVQVFLLDHCLLIIKPKFIHNVERYKIYKKPIPLALLSLSLPDQQHRRTSSILPYGRPSASSSVTSLNNIDAIAAAASNANSNGSKGYPITFNYLGRRGAHPITLYATTLASRRQWIDKIQGQRQALMEKQKVFDIKMITAKFFNSVNRVNCAASYGQSVVLGSDQGVYLKKPGDNEQLVRLLPMDKVSQIDVLERFGLILVLSDKTLYTYSLDSLLADDIAKRGRKLSSHVSFFKVGTILKGTPGEKTLVCFVRCNTISSTIRALEPHVSTEKKNRSKLGRFMRGSGEGLKVYKDLYLPGEALSIQYFRNIICVGSPKGFQMVDLASTEVQSVLDPNDGSHHAILQRENLRPISMFRHPNGDILLCYDEMAFYIDKKGRRSRPDWMIQWEGQPTAFALSVPYIVAFDPTFIEVRHMDTGDLVQVIPGKNVRCLQPDSMDKIYCAMDDPVLGTELVFELIRLQ